MDLLFKEYASPFILLNEVIASGRFEEFIDTFAEQRSERMRWEYYIHKIPAWNDISWKEFNETIDAEVRSQTEIENIDLEATVSNSFTVLQNFITDEGVKM